MQIHQIKRAKQKSRKRIGRGGKRGTYSGRGMKGQKSRAGARIRPAIRDFIEKIPKIKGVPSSRYKKQGVKQVGIVYRIVNLDILEKKFKDGEVVSPKTLLQKRLVRRIKGREPKVKILGKGELKKELKFEGVVMSKSVRSKVSAKGGSQPKADQPLAGAKTSGGKSKK